MDDSTVVIEDEAGAGLLGNTTKPEPPKVTNNSGLRTMLLSIIGEKDSPQVI